MHIQFWNTVRLIQVNFETLSDKFTVDFETLSDKFTVDFETLSD
jgi:hypothetical protein